jgi:hypothetical protein
MVTFGEEEGFLSDSFISRANEILKLDSIMIHAFISAAAIVREDVRLLELAINCRNQVLDTGADEVKATAAALSTVLQEKDEYLKSVMGGQVGMFMALLAILILPSTIDRYRSKGIDNNVLFDTMSDIGIWMKSYHDKHGVWGLDNMKWLLNHLNGRLYRLGRLQFVCEPFRHSVIVLRNLRNGKVATLSEAGVDYRKDGRVDGTNRIYDQIDKWTACFKQENDCFMGSPLLSSGLAQNIMVHLPTADWRIVLQRGELVLNIHIPEDGKMSPELCRESFFQAVDFYQTYFPEQSYSAFVCTSWLMDPQFQAILPASSNIVKFQKEFYLFPVRSNEDETFFFFFFL